MASKASNSAGLQLADLVARPIGRYVIDPKQSNRAFDVLKKKFFCEGGRECVGADFEDRGLKRFPGLWRSERPWCSHQSPDADREPPIHLLSIIVFTNEYLKKFWFFNSAFSKSCRDSINSTRSRVRTKGWMLRASRNGRLFKDFCSGYVAIGWNELEDLNRDSSSAWFTRIKPTKTSDPILTDTKKPTWCRLFRIWPAREDSNLWPSPPEGTPVLYVINRHWLLIYIVLIFKGKIFYLVLLAGKFNAITGHLNLPFVGCWAANFDLCLDAWLNDFDGFGSHSYGTYQSRSHLYSSRSNPSLPLGQRKKYSRSVVASDSSSGWKIAEPLSNSRCESPPETWALFVFLRVPTCCTSEEVGGKKCMVNHSWNEGWNCDSWACLAFWNS